jgi:hypothetical protein
MLRDAWRAKMDNPAIVDTVAAKLADLAAERDAVVKERESVKGLGETPAPGEALADIKTLADLLAADNSNDMRTRVRSAVRSIVETVYVLAIGSRAREIAAVRLQFRSARHRDYVLLARSASRTTPAQWACESFASAGLPTDADLRDQKQAAKLEALLTRHAARQ